MIDFTYQNFQIRLSDEVLNIFEENKQVNMCRKEIGGQLFGELSGSMIFIKECSATKGKTKRTRFSFLPERKREQEDIYDFHERDLHYLGDWHTHPQKNPNPSYTDENSMIECFKASKHDLPFFVMIIVGTLLFPEGLSVNVIKVDYIERIIHVQE